VAWTAVVAVAASLLAAFRHLALPAGDLREASIKTIRFRLLNVPSRTTRGQRKTYLHRRNEWPWTPAPIAAWDAVKARTDLTPTHPDDQEPNDPERGTRRP
jgi:hypothetical protein